MASPSAERVCRACGSDRLREQWPAMEPGFVLLRCEACETLRTWPEVPDDEIGKWYPQTYYGDENVRFHPWMEWMTHRFAIARARGFAQGMPPGRMLDVGCGRGITLKAFRELGWRVQGVEFGDDAAWHARERVGAPVHVGGLDELEGSYDLALFWHSLEHFRRPDLALEQARRLVRPGGRLIVAVPNAASVQARSFGRQWFHLDVPRHYHHFTLASLEAMLARHGFRLGASRHMNLEQNPYGVLQSFMNRLGFPENFLYSLLKSESARTHRPADHPGLVFGTAVMLPVGMLLAAGMSLVEAALERGGTVEVHATRGEAVTDTNPAG